MQKYDTDPAAKAAAATSLASKLGADSGLKLYMEDESKSGAPTGKANNVEPVQSSGLRNRKQGQTQSTNLGTTTPNHTDQQLVASGGDQTQTRVQKQPVVVEHHQPQSSNKYAGGWIAQIAALLVGEDPLQSYALICGNCYMHNGKWNRFNVTDFCSLTSIAVNERVREFDVYCTAIYGWLKLSLSITDLDRPIYTCSVNTRSFHFVCSYLIWTFSCVWEDISSEKAFYSIIREIDFDYATIYR